MERIQREFVRKMLWKALPLCSDPPTTRGGMGGTASFTTSVGPLGELWLCPPKLRYFTKFLGLNPAWELQKAEDRLPSNSSSWGEKRGCYVELKECVRAKERWLFPRVGKATTDKEGPCGGVLSIRPLRREVQGSWGLQGGKRSKVLLIYVQELASKPSPAIGRGPISKSKTRFEPRPDSGLAGRWLRRARTLPSHISLLPTCQP